MPGPIFVNSSFRTSSTWVWERLRRIPKVKAYYEIFHPQIIRLNEDLVRSRTYDSWDSKHPSCEPYFLEFLPLLAAEGGVPLYQSNMALGNYIPADGIDGTLSEEQQSYIRLLINHAVSNGTVPVLTCTRTLGRVRALRKAFGGQSVLIYRNMFQQWGSYCYQEVVAREGSFLSSVHQIIDRSLHDPFVKAVSERFPDNSKCHWSEDGFARFLLLHLYSYACAFDASDLVIDVNAIAADPQARARTETALSAMIGSPVDLSGARESFQYSPLGIENPRAFFDTIDQYVQMIAANPLLSPQAVDFLFQIWHEALLEWDRHEFYSHQARIIHQRQLVEMRNFRMEVLAGRVLETERECARLRAELAMVQAEGGMSPKPPR